MREPWDVLVASSSLEDRMSLLRILNRLSLNVISCSALDQAQEVLTRRRIPLVFCDEYLNGGGYRDLLLAASRRPARIVVTIRNGDWDEYLNAMRDGAFDAIRFPLHPTDVELVVLRAMREDREAASYQSLASD